MTEAVQAVKNVAVGVARIMVVGVQPCCASLQYCLIQELLLYDFKQSHNAVRATKNICCIKDECKVDHRWFQKSCTGCKNLDD